MRLATSLAAIALVSTCSVVAMPAIGARAPSDSAAEPSATDLSSPNAGMPAEIVVVTAQRREQSILSVPLAVTAVSGADLQEKGIVTSADLASVVPNLQVNSPFGQTQPNFSLRGVSVANEYNSNQASPIGVYIDDVYIASRTSQGISLFDLDRVEVLRGPQGTLFGRNTTGGAINFITKEPSLEGTNGYLQLGYGNFDTFTAQGAFETTTADDQVGVRLAGNVAEGDGMFKNVFPGGRDPDSTNTLQGRASFRIKPTGSGLDVNIVAYGGRDNGTQAPVFGLLPFRQGLNFFEVDENRVGHNKTSAWGLSANVAYEIDPQLTFISITSYDGGGQNLQQAADGSPLDVLDINWRSQFRQFSEEARVNYSNDWLTLIGGVYYGWDSTVTDNQFNIGSILGPGVNGGFFQHFRQARDSYAAFAQGDITLMDHLILTLGIRYTKDTAHYEDGHADLFVGDVGGPSVPLATTVPCPGVPGTCPYDPSARFNLKGDSSAPTGRVALSYTFEDGILGYVSYNRGYRSGAFNGGGYTSSSGIDYIKPETVNAYEAGLKGQFLDSNLTLALAGFFYDYRNQQLQDTRPGPVAFLVNAPKSQNYGAEAEATFHVTPDFVLNGSVGYLSATYQKLSLQNTDLAGNELPFAPHWTLQGGFDWHVARVFDGDVMLSPTVYYSSHQFFSPFNDINVAGSGQDNAELQQDGYAKVNASLDWVHDNWTLRLWANNIFNAKVLGYGLDLRGAGFPYNFLVPEAPQTYGVQARVSF
jgi:iron complex outermembrane receptor protein